MRFALLPLDSLKDSLKLVGLFYAPDKRAYYQKRAISQFFHPLLNLAHKPLFITYHLCKKQFYAHFKPIPETQVHAVP
jgi:hypothetical protein